MNINSVNSGIGAAPVSSAATSCASEVKTSSAAAATCQDSASIGETEAKPKGKFGKMVQWFKDLVKTEVEGPTETYSERTFRRLADCFTNENPGDVPSTMPGQSKSPAAEPEKFYLSDGTPASSGASLPTPPEQAPTRADVADYKEFSSEELVKNYFGQERSKLPVTARRVIKEYTGQAFMAMNGYLLGSTADNKDGLLDKSVRCAAGALDKCEVPPRSVLYRSADLGELRSYVTEPDYAKYKNMSAHGKNAQLAEILDARLQGTQSIRPTFLSTTISSEFKLVETGKVYTKMYVGEGVKGVYVSGDSELATFNGEEEYLLAPDTKVTVLGVDYAPETDGMVMHVLLGDLPK